jgi:hypothetical protein
MKKNYIFDAIVGTGSVPKLLLKIQSENHFTKYFLFYSLIGDIDLLK